MCQIQLWLLAFLAFISLTDGYQLEVMSAPNLLVVGSTSNIFVEIQDCTLTTNVRVEIRVMNHPTKIKRLASTYVTLTNANKFQEIGQIMVPVGEFSTDPNIKQYVYLQAHFPGRVLEKVVLVSFQTGHIFIQTDKTLYTPNSLVNYRIFAMMHAMDPLERDDSVRLEIMTPRRIITPLDVVSLTSGIHSGSYRLGENFVIGKWKIVAKFNSNPRQSFAAEFEVKEYVLPSFEVELTPLIPFFYVDSQELTVNIRATYLFGEAVDGMALAVFGVMQGDKKTNLPNTLQRLPIQRGIGAATLRREHLTQAFRTIQNIVGSSIFVYVIVLTDDGSDMLKAESREIKIVTSPYTINFKKTPKYFKPGMSFDVTVEVLNPDDTPAWGVSVVVNPGLIQGRTAANGIVNVAVNTLRSHNRLTITAETTDPVISRARQASAIMEALPYDPKSNYNIHISVGSTEVELGHNLLVSLVLSRQANAQNDITYLVLSKGQLVKHGKYKLGGQFLFRMVLPITKEMLPSFRLIAYFHTNDNEVVSNSIWVDVKDTCMGSLKLGLGRSAPSYRPRSLLDLKITGDPGATVGLVAVNVHVLKNKYRLTQKKVWDIIEKSDTGCTPGGGKDAMSVFYDAGLLFESSASGTPYRQDLECPAPSRRKRATSLNEEHDDLYIDKSEIISSTHLPESWLWLDIKLPPCPAQSRYCHTTSVVKRFVLQDSVTSWQFTGISLSRSHGICVADPLEIIVRKDFFIDLKLPYSTVVGEQLEIKAILYNYSPETLTVRVDFLDVQHVCSAAFNRESYRQIVNIDPQTTQSVPFIIIPLKEGKHSIEVKASARDSDLSDGIRKTLLVLPDGLRGILTKVITLDPATKGVGGRQEEIFKSGIPSEPVSESMRTFIFVTGEQSARVEDVITGDSMDAMIYNSSGMGDMNLFHITIPAIATMYLDATNQWETVGFQKRNEALRYIRAGCQKELASYKSDGSLAPLSYMQTSNWLTAYAVKVFNVANSLVEFQRNIICDAIKFLILSEQQQDGTFRDDGALRYIQIRGDVLDIDADVYMTAFCLIAIQESRALCASTVSVLPRSINTAVAYLVRRLSSLTNPTIVAMVSYALANENILNREILYKFVSTDLSHWPVANGHVFTLEATAYALIALVKAKAFEDARPVVRWLKQQQRDRGRYGSIMATTMVYQAVAEYKANAKEDYNLNVDVLIPGRSRPDMYNFNRNNYYITRTSEFRYVNENIKVTATGTGRATLKMETTYYTLQSKRGECLRYSLSVQLVPEKLDEDERIYKLQIGIMHKEIPDTNTILEIGLLTGFTVNTDDLNLLSRQGGHTIAKYGMQELQRGSLIIYLNKVSHTRPEEIVLRMHQTLKVGILQPAAVSVYEPYDQSKCVKFYRPESTNGQLLKTCRTKECTCAEGNCPSQKMNVHNDNRIAMAYDVKLTRPTNFVYKVRVESFTRHSITDFYTVTVVEVIKEGTIDMSRPGELSHFIIHPECSATLRLITGSTYLIMGSSKDLQRDEKSQSYIYTLGEGTWIEYWPTNLECQTDKYRPTCVGIGEMEQLYTLFGCHGDNGNCAMPKTDCSSNERIAQADGIPPTSQIDFVYKVRVESYKQTSPNDIYTMRIVEILKQGVSVSLLDKQCSFLSHQQCKSTLYLKSGNTYLIMGSSKEIHIDEQSQTCQYVFSERTWMEYWPTEAECQTEEHVTTCFGMVELRKNMFFQCVP